MFSGALKAPVCQSLLSFSRGRGKGSGNDRVEARPSFRFQ